MHTRIFKRCMNTIQWIRTFVTAFVNNFKTSLNDTAVNIHEFLLECVKSHMLWVISCFFIRRESNGWQENFT